MKYQLFKSDEFMHWIKKLKDRNAVVFIAKRLQRAELGNLGDYKALADEIYEMRIHYAGGYRLYFGIDNGKIIVLTNGGDKSTQRKDIL